MRPRLVNSANWTKVAGRMDKKHEEVVLGGVKQSLYAVYGALSNSKKSSYYQIRGKEVPADVLKQRTDPLLTRAR